MLRVSRSQIDQIAQNGQAGSFRTQLRNRLCADFEAAPHGQDRVLTAARADGLWTQGLEYGMQTQSDMTRYSYLMMGLWDRWETSPDAPWISQVMLRKDLSGTAKMDFVYSVMESAP